MNRFKSRVFGGPVDKNVRDKLSARQLVASSSLPNETIYNDILNTDILTAGYDGSSRTPFTRMYTVVERIPRLKPEEISKIMANNLIEDTGGISYDTDKIRDDIYKKERETPTKKIVYMLGEYKGKSVTPTDTIQSGDDLYKQQQSNEFLKQDGGIKSLSTKTEGDLGALVSIIIDFKVNNFQDFENIYSKYFLRPGAIIIVDFGWHTSNLYDPDKIIRDPNLALTNLIGPNSIVNHLHRDGGEVENSAGDLMVMAGQVMDFNSKVAEDGTFDCSLTLTTSNRGLIDQNLDAEDESRKKLTDRIDVVINTILYNNLLSDEVGKININRLLSTSQPETLKKLTDFYENPNSNLFGEAKGDPWKGDPITPVGINSTTGIFLTYNTNEIYCSIGLLEDKILNRTFSSTAVFEDIKGTEIIETKFGSPGSFDSSESFIYIDENIRSYAKWAIYHEKSPTLAFPDNYNESYNTFLDSPKTPTIHDRAPNGDREAFDKERNQVPIREVFINIKLVKEKFKEEKFRIAEAMQSILDDIGKEYPVYNLAMFSPTTTNEHLSIVDTEKPHSSKLSEAEFVFKPFSKQSQVLNMDLTYTLPKGDLASMIAIQNASINDPIKLTGKNIASLETRALSIDNESPYHDRVLQGTGYKKSEVVNISTKNDGTTAIENEVQGRYGQALSETAKIGKILNNETDDERSASGFIGPRETKPRKRIDDTSLDTMSYKYWQSVMRTQPKSQGPAISYELSLTIYGTAGIYPGDIITVDYLPKAYRDNVTFMVMGVEQKLDQGWTTTLTTQMITKDIPPLKYRKSNPPPKPKTVKIPVEEVKAIPVVEAEKPKPKTEPKKTPLQAPKGNKLLPGEPRPANGGLITGINNPFFVQGKYYEQDPTYNKSFTTCYEALCEPVNQSYCSSEFLLHQAVKIYKNLVPNKGEYRQPIFSGNTAPKTILEANGYYPSAFNAILKGKLATADLERWNKYFPKDNANWRQVIQDILSKPDGMMFIAMNPGERIYDFRSSAGKEPLVTWLKPDLEKPPEPYLGYEGPPPNASREDLEKLGWNNNVNGQWKSNQNSHIKDTFPELRGPSEDPFSILRTTPEAELAIKFRQTPRGKFPDSFDISLIDLVRHFAEWKLHWFNDTVVAKTTQILGQQEAKRGTSNKAVPYVKRG